jgi:hypothetical protein
MTMTAELTDRDRAILQFEGGSWWRFEGAKQQAVRDRFGLSPVRYYQLLNALIDTQAALEHDPVLVHRLQDLRDARTRQRSVRRLPTA